MAIAVFCKLCDKTYQVKDALAGKRGKCPAGHAVSVPAAAETSAAPAPVIPQRSCPSCQEILAAEAVICVQCGLDLRTGKHLQQTREDQPREPRFQNRRVLIAGAGAAAVLLIAGLAVIIASSGGEKPAEDNSKTLALAQAREKKEAEQEAQKRAAEKETELQKELALKKQKEVEDKKKAQELADKQKEAEKEKEQKQKELARKKKEEEDEALIKKYVTAREIELLKNPPKNTSGFGGLNMTPLSLAQARRDGVQIEIRDPVKDFFKDLGASIEAGLAANTPAARKELEKFQSPLPRKRDFFQEWSGISAQPNEGEHPFFMGSTLWFRSEEFEMKLRLNVSLVVGNADKRSGVVKLDPTKKPKQIDLTFTGNIQKGEKLSGIYELAGGELRLCLNRDPKNRPKAFSAAGGNILVIYRATERKNAFAPMFP